MELEREDAPVSVTLIKPSAIDTPFPDHAKNHMDEEATLPAPVYAPETVARAILHAAENPQHEVTVGAGGKGMTVLGQHAARLLDKIMEVVFYRQQRTGDPPRPDAPDGLEEPTGSLDQRGGYEGHVAETSLYTSLRQRRELPGSSALGAGLVAGAVYAGYRLLRDGRDSSGDVAAPEPESKADAEERRLEMPRL